MSEPAGRTIICSIVFIDIVRYSEAPVSHQLAMKERLNEAIAEAVGAVSEAERLVVDTGDGAAICFLGDPEDALFTATAVSEAIRKEQGEGAQALRTGINLGPVKLVTDLNGRRNVIGDGINVAQRIMSFADEGEILVSRSYYEVVARLREGNERLFHYMGSKRDKHVREHQLYAFGLRAETSHPCQPEGAPRAEPTLAPDPGPPLDNVVETAATRQAEQTLLDPQLVAIAEQRLARQIGPLATVIARRAAEQAGSIEAFCETLAVTIPDTADRASFLADLGAAPPQPEATAAAIRPVAGTASAPALDANQLEEARVRLAALIGPLAGVLVRRAAQTATGRNDLYERLATHIENPTDRAKFLAQVKTAD